MISRALKISFVVLFCLSAVLFFGPTRVDITKAFYAYYALFLLLTVFVVIEFQKIESNSFSTPVLLILIAMLISAFSATAFWGQGIIDSMKALIVYMSYLLFFLLALWKLQIRDMEKIIIILGILYILVKAIATLLYPVPIFGEIRWYDDRGFPRILIPGTGLLFLFSFYSLSRLLKNFNFLWLAVFLTTLVFIILTLTRTYIALSFAFLGLYAINKSKNIYKVGAGILIATILFLITQMEFFAILREETITETANFETNIRYRALIFYLNEFSPNAFAKIFGNGVSYYESRYGIYMRYLMSQEGLHQTDIGYIGLYSIFGILAIIAYIMIIHRTIIIKVPDEILYCKYFLYFVFVISIIISSTFSNDFIISIVLALYILTRKDEAGRTNGAIIN